MAKNFTNEFSSLLSNIGKQPAAEDKLIPTAEDQTPQEKKRGRGRPRKEAAVEEQRTTLVLPVQLLKDLQAITFQETGRQGRKVLYKDIIAEALQQYVDEYRKGGKI